jgi:hypothetical protein
MLCWHPQLQPVPQPLEELPTIARNAAPMMLHQQLWPDQPVAQSACMHIAKGSKYRSWQTKTAM